METTLKPLNQSKISMKIIKDLGYLFPNKNSKQKRRYCIVECGQCNKHTRINANNPNKSNVCKECFYLNNKTHGEHRNRLYKIWSGMKNRCKCDMYVYHKGRGITYCEEWETYEKFREWALLNGYSKDLSIDRINNDGNYEPSNCRWTTGSVQIANTRRLRKNNTTGHKGVTKIWNGSYQAIIGVNKKTVYLGLYKTKEEASIVRDNYIDDNKLPNTKNFK